MRNFRSISSIRRPGPTRLPKSTVLIVCEGEKTEVKYFRSMKRELRLTTTNIEVSRSTKGSGPSSVVKSAIILRDQRAKDALISLSEPYDQVWCIMDVECPSTNPGLKGACRLAKENGILVALSNPCFEFWYLLHYAFSTSPFSSCELLLKSLRKHVPKYSKSMDIYDTIRHLRHNATCNAKRILLDKTNIANPSTEVHILIELLEGLGT